MTILADIGVDWRHRNLIEELYINQKAFVMVGETLSEAYSIGRGVRRISDDGYATKDIRARIAMSKTLFMDKKKNC